LRTLIDTDDNILKEAMMLVGARTKRETIHLALQGFRDSEYTTLNSVDMCISLDSFLSWLVLQRL